MTDGVEVVFMGDRREAFAARREQRGYTQESLAAAIGVEFSTVGRWERGDLTPQPYRRPRIAKALGVSLDELGALLTPTRQTSTVPVAPLDPAEADDMNRRDLLRFGPFPLWWTQGLAARFVGSFRNGFDTT